MCVIVCVFARVYACVCVYFCWVGEQKGGSVPIGDSIGEHSQEKGASCTNVFRTPA